MEPEEPEDEEKQADTETIEGEELSGELSTETTEDKKDDEPEKDEETLKKEAEEEAKKAAEKDRLKQRRRSSLFLGYLNAPKKEEKVEGPPKLDEKPEEERNEGIQLEMKETECTEERKSSIQSELDVINENEEEEECAENEEEEERAENENKPQLDAVVEENEDEVDNKENDDDETKSVISVSVTQLEGSTGDRSRRQSSARSSRIRPMSGRPSSGLTQSTDINIDESILGDIEDDEADDGVFSDDENDKESLSKLEPIDPTLEESFEKPENKKSRATITENTFLQTKRPFSAVTERDEKRRQAHLRRVQSAKLNLCTVGNDGIKPFSYASQPLEDEFVEEGVREIPIEGKTRTLVSQPYKFSNSYSYCEAGIEKEEENDEDKMNVDAFVENTLRTLENRRLSKPHNATIFSNFDDETSSSNSSSRPTRVTSATSRKINHIKRLEKRILKRQSTAPELSGHDISQAIKEVQKEQNIRETECSQVELSLDFDIEQTQRSQTPYRPLSAKRPRTAISYNEHRRRNRTNQVQEKYDSGIESPDTEDEKIVKVIDLSNSFIHRSVGYPESPILSSRHHGYKSVLPLARVVSATNRKFNDGRNIELNSISRRLERREIPACWRDNERATSARAARNIETFQHERGVLSDRATTSRNVATVNVNDVDIPKPRLEKIPLNCKQCTTEKSKLISHLNRRPKTANPLSKTRPSCVQTGIVHLQLPFHTESRNRYKRTAHPAFYRPLHTARI